EFDISPAVSAELVMLHQMGARDHQCGVTLLVVPLGTIKKLVADRGFGFIAAEDGVEYFFHRSGLDRTLNFDSLQGGERVQFDIEQSQRGPRANGVRPAWGGPRARRADHLLRLRLTVLLHRLGSSRSPRGGRSRRGRLASIRAASGDSTGRSVTLRVLSAWPVETDRRRHEGTRSRGRAYDARARPFGEQPPGAGHGRVRARARRLRARAPRAVHGP